MTAFFGCCLIFFCGFSMFNASCISLQFQHVECGLSVSGFIMLSLSLSTLNACCVWMKLSRWTHLLWLDKTWLCWMHVVLALSFIMLNAHFVWVRFYHDECMFCWGEALHVECVLCFGATAYPLSRIPLKCRRSAALQEILNGHKRLHTHIMFYIIF